MLPLALTNLIGRARDTGELARLLRPGSAALGGDARPRLVTITGAGGMGKTRLALEVAHELAAAYANEVYFISLAPIDDPVLVLPRLAQTLGVAGSPDRLLEQSLAEHLRERQALVVLDNFEQVLASAPLLADLLGACPQVRLLVTSREPLHIRGEQQFPLLPLALPDLVMNPRQDSSALLQYPSVALFVQRAQASRPDFTLNAENGPAVAELCARLDGLPLAIELAAARVPLLSPQAMVADLKGAGRQQDSGLLHLVAAGRSGRRVDDLRPSAGGPAGRSALLDSLDGGPRDAPPRQRSLRATIQWSYDLLDAGEQRAFRRLAVFAGGCTLDAAKAVLAAEAGRQGERDEHGPQRPAGSAAGPVTQSVLLALVDKNLLRQSEADGEPRLGMLETIQEYALDALEAAGELEECSQAHVAAFLALAEAAARGLGGAEQGAWLARLDREHDNLRAALRRAVAQQDNGTALRLAIALSRFWFLRGHWNEGRRWMEEALALSVARTDHSALRARLAREAGALIRYQGDFERAQSLCEQSLELYRSLDDKPGMLAALIQLARLLGDRAQWEAARLRVDEALALVERAGDPRAKADAYYIAGTNALLEADNELAANRLAVSLQLMRTLGDRAGIASALSALGFVAVEQRDFELARRVLEESVALSKEVGDTRSGSRAMFALARLASAMGEYTLARRRYEDIWPLLGQLGDYNLVWIIGGLAVVLRAQGMAQWAVRLLSLAERTRVSQRVPMAPMFRSENEQTLSEARAALGEEAFAAAWAEGQRLTIDVLRTIPDRAAVEKAKGHAPEQPSAFEHEALTARELEVLRLLAEELDSPAIARRLVISPRTVHAHLRSIYDKFGVKSRDAAVRYAREHDLA